MLFFFIYPCLCWRVNCAVHQVPVNTGYLQYPGCHTFTVAMNPSFYSNQQLLEFITPSTLIGNYSQCYEPSNSAKLVLCFQCGNSSKKLLISEIPLPCQYMYITRAYKTACKMAWELCIVFLELALILCGGVCVGCHCVCWLCF